MGGEERRRRRRRARRSRRRRRRSRRGTLTQTQKYRTPTNKRMSWDVARCRRDTTEHALFSQLLKITKQISSTH